jgi:hypothetical protein
MLQGGKAKTNIGVQAAPNQNKQMASASGKQRYKRTPFDEFGLIEKKCEKLAVSPYTMQK